jgi:hypothetical protein
LPLNVRTIAILCAALGLLLPACKKEAPRKEFVARVDEATLTEADLAAAEDSVQASTQHRRGYVNIWVNNELLYQEAVRRGLGDTPEIRKQIADATRSLTIAALLSKEVYGTTNVTDDEVQALYNSGGEAFRLRDDVARVSYALFSDRDAANVFRGLLVRGTLWDAAVMQTMSDSSQKARPLQVITRQYCTESNLYPPELWKLARTLGKEEASFAVRTDAGYYVLVAHEFEKKGSLPGIDYIRSEIRDRIIIEHRRQKYDRLLTDLRSKHAVEVRLEESDTTGAPGE